MLKWLSTTSLCAMPLALCSAPAFAQSAPPTASASNDMEIVVTARKREERLLDVPVAISALSAAQLERYSSDTFATIATQTPQLQIGESQNTSGGSITLRGVGSGVTNPSGDQAVSINVDGVQVSQGNVLRLGQYDLERVEVLKGPQTLFFGKNSPGGIISLVSKDPGKDFEAQVKTGYEFEAKQKFIEGIVSGPLGGGFGARLIGYYSHQDGYWRNLAIAIPGLTPGGSRNKTNEQKEKFARGTFTYEAPSSDFKAKLKVAYGDVDRPNIGFSGTSQQYYCPFGAPQLGGGITTDCKLDKNSTSASLDPALAALVPTYGDGTPFFHSTQLLSSLQADWNVTPDLTLSSVTGYYQLKVRNFDTFTGTNLPFLAASFQEKNQQFTQELRVTSDYSGPLNFQLGGFYQNGKINIYDNNVLIFIPGVLTQTIIPSFVLKTKAYSFFGQLRYKLTDQLEIAAGGRLSREKKEVAGTLAGSPIIVADPTKKFKDFSPDVTLTYKPTNDLSLYASFREGFLSGGYNTTPQGFRTVATPTATLTDPSYRQTTVRGGEGGVKGYLLEKQLRFDLSIYYYKFKDLQVELYNPATASTALQNAGGSKTRGAEVNLFFRPRAVPGLDLHGGLAYTKATYSSFVANCYGGQTIAMGCNLNPTDPTAAPASFGTAGNPFTAQDLGGRPFTRSPKWSANIGGAYDTDIGGNLSMTVAADGTYISSYAPDVPQDPNARQKGYWVMNGTVSLNGPDRGWQLSLIGRNLANKHAISGGGNSPFSGAGGGTATGTPADSFGSVIQPRALIVQLTVRSSLLSGR